MVKHDPLCPVRAWDLAGSDCQCALIVRVLAADRAIHDLPEWAEAHGVWRDD